MEGVASQPSSLGYGLVPTLVRALSSLTTETTSQFTEQRKKKHTQLLVIAVSIALLVLFALVGVAVCLFVAQPLLVFMMYVVAWVGMGKSPDKYTVVYVASISLVAGFLRFGSTIEASFSNPTMMPPGYEM